MDELSNTNTLQTVEPNLDPSRPTPLLWTDYVAWVLPRWEALLAEGPDEKAVQSFLERNPAFLPGVNQYGSGHHSPHAQALYTQPRLKGIARDRRPDFMWIGATSEIVTPVLIEIERPGKRWFKASGELTADFNHAHGQLAEWRAWFSRPQNQLLFRSMYLDWIWDFSRRPLVPHYILIYGRRFEFDGDPVGDLLHRRAAQRREREEFMTFDRLSPNADLSDVTTVYMKSNGRLEVRALQPCFTTGPMTTDLAAYCDGLTAKVLEQVELWDSSRRSYVFSRWQHWTRERRGDMQPRSVRTGE